jgi:adenylate cyclase
VIVKQAVADLATTGTIVGGPFFMSLLAEAQWRSGDIAAALQTLGAALAFSESHDSPYWDAELLRLEGEMRGADGNAQAALPLFERALMTAEKQGSQLLVLRAATSAGRLLAGQGHGEEARLRVEPLLAALPGAGVCQDVTAARELFDSLA